jgi:voltage-gated potassium channel Kch
VAVVGISRIPLTVEGIPVVVGDPQVAETLLQAGIQDARSIVLSGNDDGINLSILMLARTLNPHIRAVNRLFNASLGDRLDRTLPEHISLSVSARAAPIFAFAALGSKAIGQLRLFDRTWPIHEESIESGHPWCGRSLAELWDNRDRMLI